MSELDDDSLVAFCKGDEEEASKRYDPVFRVLDHWFGDDCSRPSQEFFEHDETLSEEFHRADDWCSANGTRARAGTDPPETTLSGLAGP